MRKGNGSNKTLRMDDGERSEVCSKLEWEGGLEFLINGGDGSDFPQIKDKNFHQLRMDFVQAANRLEAYLRYESFLNEFPWADYEADFSDEENDDEKSGD